MQAVKPIEVRKVQPAVDRDITSQRPTEIRYAWCPYGDINLVGPDGTPTLYVQPHEIDDGNGNNIPNPYHRSLPKSQLIPFPTFAAIESMLSPDLRDSSGRAVTIQGTRTITALEAAVEVLRSYSLWGFTIFNSLQGMDQDVAMRIFQVVQPFEYPLSQLVNELSFGARERIDATESLEFRDIITDTETGEFYTVQPLQDAFEREKALALAAEMELGAEIAFNLATEQLNDTETSMTTRFAGGNGKTGPDQLDRRLSSELERDLPKMVGTNKAAELENKIDFLVGREASRADKEEIDRLKKELAAAKAGISENTMKADVDTATCAFVKGDGEKCTRNATNGDRCWQHPEEAVTE